MDTGIYKITCLSNGKFYVGSAKDILKRWGKHKSDLRRNKHHSAYMQNCYNKYGEESLKFEILELCGMSVKTEREQFYMDNLKPDFNSYPIARSSYGFPVSETTRKKLSQASKGKTVSHETRMKLSAANKGRFVPQEQKDKMKANYTFISPDGIIHRGRGIREFCEKYGLSESQMCKVNTRKQKSHQGWINGNIELISNDKKIHIEDVKNAVQMAAIEFTEQSAFKTKLANLIEGYNSCQLNYEDLVREVVTLSLSCNQLTGNVIEKRMGKK